jgi:hypothetical protein
LQEYGSDSFDLAYIDADQVNYEAHYEACLRLVRVGGLIAIDNVLWFGRVADLHGDGNEEGDLFLLFCQIFPRPCAHVPPPDGRFRSSVRLDKTAHAFTGYAG